jgi:hypothetical protein
MNKRILGIISSLCCIFLAQSCRCTRDFEEKNACCRAHIWIEVKSKDETKPIIIRSLTSEETKGSSTMKTTLNVDLVHNISTAPELYENNSSIYTLKIVLQAENMPDIEIFVRYTKRYKLISPNLGAIEQYKILSIECSAMKKKIEYKNDWLSSLDEEPDVQIFL